MYPKKEEWDQNPRRCPQPMTRLRLECPQQGCWIDAACSAILEGSQKLLGKSNLAHNLCFPHRNGYPKHGWPQQSWTEPHIHPLIQIDCYGKDAGTVCIRHWGASSRNRLSFILNTSLLTKVWDLLDRAVGFHAVDWFTHRSTPNLFTYAFRAIRRCC